MVAEKDLLLEGAINAQDYKGPTASKLVNAGFQGNPAYGPARLLSQFLSNIDTQRTRAISPVPIRDRVAAFKRIFFQAFYKRIQANVSGLAQVLHVLRVAFTIFTTLCYEFFYFMCVLCLHLQLPSMLSAQPACSPYVNLSIIGGKSSKGQGARRRA
jgi:hypothetical protein